MVQDFVVSMVLAKLRFQYGTECRSRGNGTSDDFLVNLHELSEPKLKEKDRRD